MTSMAILVALTALGVESGYEPATDGQLEYIVQIEPQLVAGLAKGKDITSELPRGLAVRHFRVTIGTGKLPKQATDNRSTRNRIPTTGQAPAEAPGVETQDVRVGYQPLPKGDGEYVIEITPTGLGDLDQHDLTGDIPPNLAISRVRISTQPGSAPADDAPPAGVGTGEPTLATGEPTLAAGQPTLAGGQPVSAIGQPAPPPSTPPIITPSAPANQSPVETPLEPLTPLEQSELEHPDTDSKFQYPPDPLAAPMSSAPASGQTGTEFAPTLANPNQAAPPPNNPRSRDGRSASNRTAPGALTADPQSAPLTGNNVTYSERSASDPSATQHQTQRPSQAEKNASGGAPRKESQAELLEEKYNDATKPWPWLPLTVTLLLFLSIGGNVYLAWVAWDARNRSRALLERFHAGELTLN
jgi:hypothetical protein